MREEREESESLSVMSVGIMLTAKRIYFSSDAVVELIIQSW